MYFMYFCMKFYENPHMKVHHHHHHHHHIKNRIFRIFSKNRFFSSFNGSGGPGTILDQSGVQEYPRGLIFSFIARNFEKNSFFWIYFLIFLLIDILLTSNQGL